MEGLMQSSKAFHNDLGRSISNAIVNRHEGDVGHKLMSVASMMDIPALLPLRDGKPLNSHHYFRCNCPLFQMMDSQKRSEHPIEDSSNNIHNNMEHFHTPYIPLVHTLKNNNDAITQILGRFEFFISTWTACSCITLNPKVESHHPIATCIQCQESTKTWAKDFISKRFIQVELSCKTNWIWKLTPLSTNVPVFLRIDGVAVDDKSSYYLLHMGSIVSLVNSKFSKPHIDEMNNRATLHFRVGWVSPILPSDVNNSNINVPIDMVSVMRPVVPTSDNGPSRQQVEVNNNHCPLTSKTLDTDSSSDVKPLDKSLTVEILDASSSSGTYLNTTPITIFPLTMGKNMSSTRVKSLTHNFQKKVKNAFILSSLSDSNNSVHTESSTNKIPNIIVVDRTLNVEQVSKALGFQNPDEFQVYLQDNKIQVVSPEWMVKCEVSNYIPREYRVEFRWPKSNTKAPSSSATLKKSSGWLTTKRKEPLLDIGEPPSVKASACFNPIIQGELKRRKEGGSPEEMISRIQMVPITTVTYLSSTEAVKYSKNLELSDLLDRISKIYSESPLHDSDIWRGYTYKKAAGCLRYLDFEVDKDQKTLQKLRVIRGLGDKVLEHIIEYLTSNRSTLIQQLENDPKRVAVKKLMGIWGVGPTKAYHLIKLGCKDINDVLDKIKSKNDKERLNLSRHILIGIQCYDDLLEKMDRTEVQQIGAIVEKTVMRMFPEANVLIMGSYRREKEKCGDVDILITHPNYTETTPLGAIDWLVESLKMTGNIAYHLTSVDTAMYSRYECLHNRNDESYDECFIHYNQSATYMGVFSSPTSKMRRIDIKFYPWKERATAMLYFTGSDYFNRSMRLMAKKKHFHLDDHGLFVASTNGLKGDKLLTNTERDVFDLLGLEYKEPMERLSWESIQEKGALVPFFPDGDE